MNILYILTIKSRIHLIVLIVTPSSAIAAYITAISHVNKTINNNEINVNVN